MIHAIVCALALSATNPAQPPRNQDPTAQGTQESVPRYQPGGGMTLEALHGLPRFRPTYYPVQPQIWLYQPTWVYPAYGNYSYPYGLGGYQPPRTGYNPQAFIFAR
jgi:hypothetical protein